MYIPALMLLTEDETVLMEEIMKLFFEFIWLKVQRPIPYVLDKCGIHLHTGFYAAN